MKETEWGKGKKKEGQRKEKEGCEEEEEKRARDRAGGVVQVVACLPSKHEVLSSTPILPKKKKKLKNLITKLFMEGLKWRSICLAT
jgi:hypothetical protein